jgi:predicted peptidase
MFGARGVFTLLAVIILTLGIQTRARAGDTGFLNRTVKVGAENFKYQVYVPSNWTKKQKWPVILFLHGAGERGDDGLLQTEVGIGTVIRRHPERVPAIVVLPQCEKGHWWLEPAMQAQALGALNQSIKEFNGDATRTYLTGLSMGGNGTWEMAANNLGKFAAIAPICGPVRILPRYGTMVNDELQSEKRYQMVAQKIGKIPVWVFHGEADTVVPVSESRMMVEAIKAAGGDVRYNEYVGVGHDSWNKAYMEPGFFPWLFSYELNSAGQVQRHNRQEDKDRKEEKERKEEKDRKGDKDRKGRK